MVDVAVVGAGPAGIASAIELARAGLDVAVLDRATFPRDKCCGDGLTTGALRRLDRLGLRPDAVRSWQAVDTCSLRSPSGWVAELDLPTGGQFAAVARRSDLDAALVDLARAAGAKVHEGRTFRTLSWSGEGVTISADGGGAVGARYVVAADGVWSPVRKAIGLSEPGYLGDWHAFRQYLRVPAVDTKKLWIWFERDLLPGYAWSFPLPGGVANVGFGIVRRPGTPTRMLADRWRRLLATPHVAEALGEGAVPDAPHRTWPIPSRLPSSAVAGAGGRVLLAGDAARAADPLTGEGIGQALESGIEAACAILSAGPRRPEVAATRYQRVLAAGMTLDHHLASGLSHVLKSERRTRAAVRVVSSSAWSRRNFARWLFEDYPRAGLATPARWHRGLLHGSGAYGDQGR